MNSENKIKGIKLLLEGITITIKAWEILGYDKKMVEQYKKMVFQKKQLYLEVNKNGK